MPEISSPCGEVVDEIGPDAFRFMLLTRSADSQMELDLALATKQSNENPVYYVQYGHARIASIFRKAEAEGASMAGGEVARLSHPAELELISGRCCGCVKLWPRLPKPSRRIT